MDLAAIQRALARIYTDSAFRECFLARPLAAGQALGLTAEEAEWLAQLPPGQVRFFARALQRKRLGQVARLLPLTCRSLGGEFERLFLHYADTASPGGARNCRDDAIAFVASLQEHSITGRLTPPWAADLARYEATWLQAARSATQCLAGSFRYPVGPLIRSLIAGQEEPHLPAQATLALWIRFSRNGRLHHEVLPLGRPRPALASSRTPMSRPKRFRIAGEIALRCRTGGVAGVQHMRPHLPDAARWDHSVAIPCRGEKGHQVRFSSLPVRDLVACPVARLGAAHRDSEGDRPRPANAAIVDRMHHRVVRRRGRTMFDERPILALVGGNGSSTARFERVLPLLAAWCRPVVVELAGQGGRAAAPVPVPGTLAGFAADLGGELASAAEGEAFLAYGHGVGGLVLAHALRGAGPAHAPALPAGRLVLHAPVGAHLPQRRFPWLMAWPPLRALVQAVLGSSLLGPRLARRLMERGGAATLEDLRAFAAGYRGARSFGALFAAVDPLAALEGLEELTLPVTLLWGGADRVLRVEQLAAWAEVLRRAPVIARIEPEWRHYPYLDRPAEFAAVLATCVTGDLPQQPVALDRLREFRPRTKAGRLTSMRRAGLPVPAGWWVPPEALANGSAARLFAALPRDRRYAVRSSAVEEDQAEQTAAGVFHSDLDVAPPDLKAACERVARSGQAEYFANYRPTTTDGRPTGQETGVTHSSGLSDARQATGVEAPVADRKPRVEILVQEMAPRSAGGVAWVRALGIDLEIGAGAIERSVAGSEPVTRASLSQLGAPWEHVPPDLPAGLTAACLQRELWPLLRRAHALFDLGALDVEWTFDPAAGFRLVQARPVGERHGPRRLLSAANLREVLPPDPSPFLIGATAAVSLIVPRYYARHDRAVATWREPFSVVVGGRTYLNADLFAALMDRWGLPRRRVALTVGGRLPAAPVRIDRWLRAMPSLLRQARDLCRVSPESQQTLAWLRGTLIHAEDLPALAGWFVAAFGALVTANLRIGGALFLAAPWRGPEPPEVVTAQMARELRAAQQVAAGRGVEAAAIWRDFAARWGHRGEYESDPARPRGAESYAPETPLPLDPSPFLPDPLAALPAPLRTLPFLAPGHLLAHREWFRDSVMRLWAAFRARALQHARELADAGLLEQPEDLWWLTPEEIRTLPVAAWRARAAARRDAPPEPAITADLFWSDTLELLDHPGGGQLPLVPGVVTGPALVARTPSEALVLLECLPAGAGAPVLLAPAVDPGWLPVFVRVAGVAAELGGRLSHAAILLRELGIPSVLNLAGVTATARTGEPVRLVVPPGRVERVVEAGEERCD